MLEILREIPGPIFLLLYAGVILLGLLLGRKWIEADGSTEHPLPDFAQYDPISLAFLMGGINEVIRVAVFRLGEKQLIEIKIEAEHAKNPGFTVLRHDPSGLSRIEQEIFLAIQTGKVQHSEDLFKIEGLRDKLEYLALELKHEFVRTKLLRDKEETGRAQQRKIIVILLVLAIGLSKLCLGLYYERPVLFLSIMLIVAPVLLLFRLRVNQLTTLGKRYLRELTQHFRWVASDDRHGSIDPALVLVIFGAASLGGTAQYQAFQKAFPGSRGGDASNHGSSGGCGASSGCGGGGGGSDGGGGGCGGCGGGGGD